MGLWLVLPAIAIMVFFNIYPFIETVRLSFYQYVLTKPDYKAVVGFANYIALFKDYNFYESLKVTVIYVFAAVIVEMIVGFWIASILNRDIPGKNIFTSIFLIPIAMTPVIIGFFWRAALTPEFGIIGYLLKSIGLGKLVPIEGFIGKTTTALPLVILVDIWQWISFVVLITLAGLRSLPLEPFEAAEVDGANDWQKFRFITIPLLKPVLMVVLLFRTMDSFRIFDIIWIISKGGPGRATETLSIWVYKTSFYFWNIGYGTTITMIMLIIVIIVANIMIRNTFKEFDEN